MKKIQNFFLKKLALCLIISCCYAANGFAQFAIHQSDGMDHNHYSTESYEDFLYLGGTAYPAGSLTNTNIHVQKMDNNGNILWEIYHDIGTDERCLDLSLEGSDYVLLTGSTMDQGENKIFVMRLNQADGSLVDVVRLIPDPSINRRDQIGVEIYHAPYAPGGGSYFILGKAGLDLNNVATNVSMADEMGLIICLDANLQHLWTRKLTDLHGSALGHVSVNGIAEIPGLGVCVSTSVNLPDIILLDYSGNVLWRFDPINAGARPSGIVYDQSTDEILVSYFSGSSSAGFLKILNASSPSPTISNYFNYNTSNNSFGFYPAHISIDLNTNSINLWGISAGGGSTLINSVERPAMLSIDYTSNASNFLRFFETYAPFHYAQDYPYYRFTHQANFAVSDAFTKWGDGYGVVSYDYSDPYGNSTNTYNISVFKTNELGLGEHCDDLYFPVDNQWAIQFGNRPTALSNSSYTIDPISSVETFTNSDQYFDCYDPQPCQISINGLSRTDYDCYAYNYVVDYSSNNGTVAYEFIWDFGDGSKDTTNKPTVKYDYGMNAGCKYKVCVTIKAYGSDGSMCQKTLCQTFYSLTGSTPGCPGCGKSSLGSSQTESGSSISELEKQVTFQAYPNPSTGEFTLTFSSGIYDQISIRNAIGQEIKLIEIPTSENPATQLLLDLNNEENGIYFVTISNQNERKTIKLSKH